MMFCLIRKVGKHFLKFGHLNYTGLLKGKLVIRDEMNMGKGN